MVEVARIAARLPKDRAGQVLEQPHITSDVATLDLVRGGRRAPKETIRKTPARDAHNVTEDRGCSYSEVHERTTTHRTRFGLDQHVADAASVDWGDFVADPDRAADEDVGTQPAPVDERTEETRPRELLEVSARLG